MSSPNLLQRTGSLYDCYFNLRHPWGAMDLASSGIVDAQCAAHRVIALCGEDAAVLSPYLAVLPAQPRTPRVARKRPRQYQRRAIASRGFRTSCAIIRISTMVMSFLRR